MFVFVDPLETEREKNLRKSKIRSHATSVVHQRRLHKRLRKTKASDDNDGTVSCTPKTALETSAKWESDVLESRWVLQTTTSTQKGSDESATAIPTEQNKPMASKKNESGVPAPLTSLTVHGDLASLETRAMHFFLHRTAQEWCNWGEMRLMMQYVPQASVQIPALRYAMISLGAYHEYLDQSLLSAQISQARNVALVNATKTIKQLRTDHGLLSIGSILMAHIILTLITSNLNDAYCYQAEYMQYQLFDNVKRMVKQNSSLISKSDLQLITDFLIPLIDKQDGKEGLHIDAICCLRNTKATEFFPQIVAPAPFFFNRIEQAYIMAETLLENAAYAQKTSSAPIGTIPEECDLSLWLWKNALNTFASSRIFDRQEQLTISVLRLAVDFGVMMIAAMNSKTEMVFDEYNNLYDNLNTILQASHDLSQENHTVNVNFGLSAKLLCFASNSVLRWCRDPSLRSMLLKTMTNIHRRDGLQGSYVWARIARAVQHAEESAVTPAPKTCADIPESSRLMLNTIFFYATSGMVKLELFRDPWNKRITEEIWITWDGDGDVIVEQLSPMSGQELKSEMPIIIMGRGYTSRLDQTGGKGYQTRRPRFYFPLPRR